MHKRGTTDTLDVTVRHHNPVISSVSRPNPVIGGVSRPNPVIRCFIKTRLFGVFYQTRYLVFFFTKPGTVVCLPQPCTVVFTTARYSVCLSQPGTAVVSVGVGGGQCRCRRWWSVSVLVVVVVVVVALSVLGFLFVNFGFA